MVMLLALELPLGGVCRLLVGGLLLDVPPLMPTPSSIWQAGWPPLRLLTKTWILPIVSLMMRRKLGRLLLDGPLAGVPVSHFLARIRAALFLLATNSIQLGSKVDFRARGLRKPG